MSSEEIGSLVWHRLRRAGCRRADLFSDEAIAAVASYANGVPGRAVRLCAATLSRAAAAQSGKITAALVREAARTLAPDAEAATPRGASGRRWYEPCATPAPTRPRSALVAPFGIAVACLAGLAVAAAGVVVAVPESVRSATLRQTLGAAAPKIVAAAEPAKPFSGDVRPLADVPAKAQGPIVEPTTPLPPLDAERPPAAVLAPAAPAPASHPREAADKAAPVLPRPAPEPPATATIAPSLPTSQAESRIQDTPRAMTIALVEPAPTPQVRAPEMPVAAAEPVSERKSPDAELMAPTTAQAEPAPAAQDPAQETPATATTAPAEPAPAAQSPAQETPATTTIAPAEPTPAAQSPVQETPAAATAASPEATAPPETAESTGTSGEAGMQADETPTSGTTEPEPTPSPSTASGDAEPTEAGRLGTNAPPASAGERDERVEVVRLLLERGARQVAAGQIAAPANDNAVNTYREIMLIAPDGRAGPMLLESIRARYRAEAREAKDAGNDAEAQRLETLARDPLAGVGVAPTAEAAPVESTGTTAPPAPQAEAAPKAEAADTAPPEPGVEKTAAEAAAPPASSGSEAAAAPMPTSTVEQTAVTPSPPTTGGKPLTAAPRPASISKEMIGALMKRGGEMLAIGDISAARLLYERAAAGGDAKAATAAGKTYDPLFLRDTAARGVQPQPERAADWYRRALEAGDAEAGARLTALQAATGQ
jgi:hypothetical protein